MRSANHIALVNILAMLFATSLEVHLDLLKPLQRQTNCCGGYRMTLKGVVIITTTGVGSMPSHGIHELSYRFATRRVQN